MTRETIIAKVKNLFDLAKSDNENEAKAAALKAQEIMAKYHLDDHEVQGGEVTEEIVEHLYNTGVGNKWKVPLALSVAKSFRCKVYTQGNNEFVFYGFSEDSEAAQRTFEYLFTTCKRIKGQKERELRKQGYNVDGEGIQFALGFVAGVKEAFERQCTALLVITPKEVEDSYKEMTSDKSAYSTRHIRQRRAEKDSTYYADGIFAGRSAVGTRAVEGSF